MDIGNSTIASLREAVVLSRGGQLYDGLNPTPISIGFDSLRHLDPLVLISWREIDLT